jgi:HPt (histidine-containing phosphotransfer) domain-containing protein
MECNINLSYIKEIVGEDPVMLKEFIADIVSQMEEADRLFQQYIQQRDLDGLAQTAHRLKSSLQIIGATSLASKLNELETIATNTRLPQDIISVHEVIKVLSENCRAKLNSEL